MALNAGRGRSNLFDEGVDAGRLFARIYVNLSVVGFPCHDHGCIARPFPSSRARSHHEQALGHLPAAPVHRAAGEAAASSTRARLEFGRRPRPAPPDRPG